jgi:DNA-binding phage protein
MSITPDLFWSDLQENLKNPEYLREYIVESVKIQSIDSLMNTLDEARIQAGISKAELARSINASPESVRRLLSNGNSNPTFGTLAEVAAALGFAITVRPLSDDERAVITSPLRDGTAADLKQIATAHAVIA